AEIMREQIGTLDQEQQKKYLDIILQQSDRLTRLINDLLDIQRFEAGRRKDMVSKGFRNPERNVGNRMRGSRRRPSVGEETPNQQPGGGFRESEVDSRRHHLLGRVRGGEARGWGKGSCEGHDSPADQLLDGVQGHFRHQERDRPL
ncbi:MAG: hypothetical protein JTT11_10590, partial [Candidatus Brockarchaeota archaeon]|nr:hypothetical protein [Candidatus Brockarchaeota archaeon]